MSTPALRARKWGRTARVTFMRPKGAFAPESESGFDDGAAALFFLGGLTGPEFTDHQSYIS